MSGNWQLFRIPAAVAMMALLPAQSFGWGREGHHIIALLAESRLNATAKARVAELLGGETMAQASTWPDEIRKEHEETSGWHYVSIPRDAAFFNNARDCYQPDSGRKGAETDHQNCAPDRIDLYARQLADPAIPQTARVEALKYLIHFLSDLHQPMHAMGEGHGGNDIHVVEFGKPTCGVDRPCNLHGLWDSGLIEHADGDEVSYMHKLQVVIAREGLENIPEGTPADWANESHVLAEGALLEEGGAADQVYFDHEISVVDRRLALAGIRLSRMLNSVLGASDGGSKVEAPSASIR